MEVNHENLDLAEFVIINMADKGTPATDDPISADDVNIWDVPLEDV